MKSQESELHLFNLKASQATVLAVSASDLKKPLQALIKHNLEDLLDIQNPRQTTGRCSSILRLSNAQLLARFRSV